MEINNTENNNSSSVRQLPHDLLAEKSLLGCLLVDGQAMDEVSDLNLTKDDFFHPKYAKVFDVMVDLSRGNQPIDYVTVCSKLSDRGELESLGGQSFIAEIAEDQASSANVYHYAKVVHDKASVREIVRASMRITEMGFSFSGNTDDFVQEVEAKFFKLTTDAKVGGMQKISACLKDNLKELASPAKKEGEITGIPSGYADLDKKLLGMRAGQLLILAARPGMGKTALALNMATNAAKMTKLPVAIFSLEMLAPELSMRMLSSEAKVDSLRIRTRNFLDTDLRSINKTIPELSSYPIYINDSGAVSIFDIQSQCRKIKSDQGLGLVVVDYIQLMRPGNANMPREQQISEMSRGLKQLAKEMQCPVIALSQLNRGVESRTDKRPMISDLRESGSIEQDADVVLLIYRDEYYNPEDSKKKGVAEVIVAKNRAGEQGTVELSWMGSCYLFGNLAKMDEASAPSGVQ